MGDHPIVQNLERTGYPDGKGPAVCCYCAECGEEIFEGDTIYKVHGKIYCKWCMDSFREEAEKTEF